MSTTELIEYGSECCGAPIIDIPETAIKTAPGCTSYYRAQCLRCSRPCHTLAIRQWDSEGNEIKYGDIIYCPEAAEGLAWEYHAVTRPRGKDFGLEIRDLGANNVNTYNLQGPYITIGHYSKHLDKLRDEDLCYYWGIASDSV